MNRAIPITTLFLEIGGDEPEFVSVISNALRLRKERLRLRCLT